MHAWIHNWFTNFCKCLPLLNHLIAPVWELCVGTLCGNSFWEFCMEISLGNLIVVSVYFFGSEEASLFCKLKQICNFYHFLYHLNDPLLEFCVVTLYGYYACVLFVGTLCGYSVWVLCVGTLCGYSVWVLCLGILCGTFHVDILCGILFDVSPSILLGTK